MVVSVCTPDFGHIALLLEDRSPADLERHLKEINTVFKEHPAHIWILSCWKISVTQMKDMSHMKKTTSKILKKSDQLEKNGSQFKGRVTHT